MPFDRRAKLALIVACITLLGSGAGLRWAVQALNIYLRKEPVELRGSFATLPRTLGRWRAVGQDAVLDEAQVESLGTQFYFDRHYALEGAAGSGVMNIHVAYYTGMIDAVPHVPDRCMDAAGFNIVKMPLNEPLDVSRSGWFDDPEFVNLGTGEPYPVVQHRNEFSGQTMLVRMPLGDFKLRVTEFESEKHPGLPVFGGYFFIANGAAMATPEEVRMMAFNPREKYAYYCKVQFVYYERGADKAQYLSLVSEILRDLLPELMQRLPDWSEVERRGHAHQASVSGSSS